MKWRKMEEILTMDLNGRLFSLDVQYFLYFSLFFVLDAGDVPELVISAVTLAGGKTDTVPVLTVTT